MVSTQQPAQRPILVTGGSTFLGLHIVLALLAEGAQVTVLIPPDHEARMAPLAGQVRWHIADVWDAASLRGRARGHSVVIHTVGSMQADPARGLTYHRMNFVSTRNVITMCVSDGAPRMVYLSSAAAPWLSRGYIRSKREAESYLGRIGVKGTVIRAPLVYERSANRVPFFAMMSLMGRTPPISWLGMRRAAPMPVDILARGVARIAMTQGAIRSIYHAGDLYRLNTRDERHGHIEPLSRKKHTGTKQPAQPDDDAPFGWAP